MTGPLIEPLAPGDPRQLGGYQLIGRLGHGGMGQVYLGVSRDSGVSRGARQVAVKVMHPQLAGDTAFRERFRREAEVAQRVSGPFTALVQDSGAGEQTPWLATEYIPGPTLAQLVTGYGPLPGASVRALAAGLAQALTDIHSRRIVHRDLKPANVILSVTGPRVIDFGIARALDGMSMTATNELLGTVSYMSPEQLSGQEVTGQSDVYALGAVLVFASTGKAPQQTAFTPAPETGPAGGPGLGDVPPGLRALIARCLRPDPRQRATLAEIIGECGQPGRPRFNDWLPQQAAAFVRTRVEQQQGDATTLLDERDAAPSAGTASARPPARQRYRDLSARMALASQRWPLVSRPSLRRWWWLCLTVSLVACAEVASRTVLVERRLMVPPGWARRAVEVQATIQQFTRWLPDPVSHWSLAARSAPGMDDRLAAVTCALVVLTVIARRTRRERAHQAVIKTMAAAAADIVAILMMIRLFRTGFAPLIQISVYLRWWAFAVAALAAAVICPLAGRAR